MAREPGNLSDFEIDSLQAWSDKVEKEYVTRFLQDSGTKHLVAAAAPDWKGLLTVDWNGFPELMRSCLGVNKSMRLLDWRTGQGDRGRAIGQDEYFEWRTVRDATGKIKRVEMTTELLEYWQILAGYHPAKTLRLIARFAGESSVPWQQVYGKTNPFSTGVTVRDRIDAFSEMMIYQNDGLPVKSPYNNGEKAICFLSKPVSSLLAAVALFAYAAFPYGKAGSSPGQEEPLSGPEAIVSTEQSAINCRNSDPTMVGSLIEQAWNGKAMAFDDPVGVYIVNVASDKLLLPDGKTPVPAEWFEYQRGSRPRISGELERSQRLVFEVPSALGFSVGDLINKDTDERIEYGGQIAELVTLAVYFRTSENDFVNAPRQIVTAKNISSCSKTIDCIGDSSRGIKGFQQYYAEFEASQHESASVLPVKPLSRSGGSLS